MLVNSAHVGLGRWRRLGEENWGWLRKRQDCVNTVILFFIILQVFGFREIQCWESNVFCHCHGDALRRTRVDQHRFGQPTSEISTEAQEASPARILFPKLLPKIIANTTLWVFDRVAATQVPSWLRISARRQIKWPVIFAISRLSFFFFNSPHLHPGPHVTRRTDPSHVILRSGKPRNYAASRVLNASPQSAISISEN